MGYADVGAAEVRARHGVAVEDIFNTRYGMPRFASGFTQPTLIYDQMRRMNLDATALDTDVLLHVADPKFKSTWSAWFSDWKAFFAKTLSTAGKFANLLATDDLREIVNSRDVELRGFHELYSRQLDAAGQPVPPSASPGAPPPLSAPGAGVGDKPTTFWSSIPWWVYGIGVATIGAVGYSFYRVAKAADARAEYLAKTVAPQVLPQLIPHVGHDPNAPPP